MGLIAGIENYAIRPWPMSRYIKSVDSSASAKSHTYSFLSHSHLIYASCGMLVADPDRSAKRISEVEYALRLTGRSFSSSLLSEVILILPI
jgi:hypothetical protein